MRHLCMQSNYTESNKCECRYFRHLHWHFRHSKKKARRDFQSFVEIRSLRAPTPPLMCSGSLPFGKCWFFKGTTPQKHSLERSKFRDEDLDVTVTPWHSHAHPQRGRSSGPGHGAPTAGPSQPGSATPKHRPEAGGRGMLPGEREHGLGRADNQRGRRCVRGTIKY